MSDDNLSNLDMPPENGNTGRIRLAVHEEVKAENSEMLSVLRRWWFIAVTVGAVVWGAAAYLGGKANANDLKQFQERHTVDIEEVKEKIEHLNNRVTVNEQLKAAVDRIEHQVYQLALRAGAPIVSQPSSPPLK